MTYFIIGTGGQARVVADILASGGHAFAFATETDLGGRYDRSAGDVVLIGIGDNATRARVADTMADVVFGTAIHPSATIARDVQIGAGTVIMPGAVINTGSALGGHVIINTNSSVDHDCTLGDYASLAPGVALGGNVKVGRGAAIGIGASVVHRCEIGEHTVVGAGAAVVNSLPAFSVCYGVPARLIRERRLDDPYL